MQTLQAQLTLGVNLRDEATFDNFYLGKNNELVALLKETAKGTGEKLVYLCSARGCGASHLLQATCHEASKYQLTSFYLPLEKLSTFSPEILIGLETLSLICIDDLAKIAGLREWEEALFHLYNKIMNSSTCLIVSAPHLPKGLNLQLPDLISRLSWGVIYQLQPLEDDEKLFALMMRAERRGMHLPEEVGKYILTHCPRHMSTLCAALDALDKATLAAQRRLTIPFVKEVLTMS